MKKRLFILTALATSVMLWIVSVAGATGFDVHDLTTSTQSTWATAIEVILGVVGVFLGAKVAIKWAMRLLAH